MKHKSKPTVALYKLLAALMVAVGFSFSRKACRKFLKQAEGQAYDVLIVPGLPFTRGRWNVIMKARVLWAKYLYDRGIAKNIIFSGAAVHSAYSESEIMCLYAKALGIPEANVFPETRAEHSTENIYYSYRLALKMGFKTMAFASDPVQTKMLRKFTHTRVHPDIALIPVVYDIVNELDLRTNEPVIDAQQAHVKGFTTLKERENLRKRLKGTSGARIDWEIYES